MTDLMIFEGHEVEVFEFEGQVLFNANHVAEILEIKNVRDNLRKMNDRQVVHLTNSAVGKADSRNSDVTKSNIRKLNNAGENFLTESGVYKLVFKSHKPNAEKFTDWIADEVLPTIRKTGGYVSNEDLFISTYLPYADESTKLIFAQTLRTVREQNETIERQKNEIMHKEDVIIGLVDDISLAEKRQDNYNKEHKPKCKGKLDYIDRVMGKIPELYEIAAKLFESDVKSLVEEMYQAVTA